MPSALTDCRHDLTHDTLQNEYAGFIDHGAFQRRSRTAGIAALLCMLTCSGCHTYRVQAHGYPGVEDHEETVVSYLWGATQSPMKQAPEQRPLASVSVTSNLLYDLISVVTLGIVSPKTVKWRYVRDEPEEGTLPEEEDGGQRTVTPSAEPPGTS